MALNKFQKYKSTQTKILPNKKQRSDSLDSNCNLQSGSKRTCSWSLHEDPFKIDHIFEQILNPLPKQKLLECRLVSHRWNSTVTSTILKDPEQKVVVELGGTKLKTLVLLLQDRKSSDILNLLAPFPVSNFNFQIPSMNKKMIPIIPFEKFINDEVTEAFFTLHGMHIKKLSLCFKNGLKARVKDLPTEGFLMKSMIKLLTCHAPKMTHLRLEVKSRNKINLDKQLRPDLRHEKFQKEIQIQMEQAGNMCAKESHLKFLQIHTGLSGQVIKSIIKMSPELREIDTNAGDLYCLLHPLNKLHLLQRLCTYPVSTIQADILQTISHLCGDGLNRMKLKELQFQAPDYLPGFEEIITSILGSVNRILKASSNSLEIICWDRAVFHVGLIWPQSLPKVSLICLRATCDRDAGGHYRRTKIFPSGFNWQKRFPNVKTFHFYVSDTQLKAIQFVNSFNLVMLQSVRDVVVRTNACVSTKDVELISAFFPSAKVTIDSHYDTISYYIPHDKL